ncbi:MAG TPA: hypothetical protein VKU00_29275, partial [Chthonomonadaceae bacterium]|nr:hypothetical protein [Chthonomonadaceae bacterium]
MRWVLVTHHILLFLLALLCAAHAAPPSSRADFYVAPDGNDRWSGTRATPNRTRTDGPFATLEGARDAIRKAHRSLAKLTEPIFLRPHTITVEIRGGRYELNRPFALTAEDTGTEKMPILYRARAGEEVRLVGGKVLKGFTPVTDAAIL